MESTESIEDTRDGFTRTFDSFVESLDPFYINLFRHRFLTVVIDGATGTLEIVPLRKDDRWAVKDVYKKLLVYFAKNPSKYVVVPENLMSVFEKESNGIAT